MNSANLESTKRFKDLQNLFEKIFASKGYANEDEFDSEVFFLSESPLFQSYKKNNFITPESDSKLSFLSNQSVFKILESNSKNGKDLKKLKVKTRNFIHDYISELLKVQVEKEKTKEKIVSFNIDESINLIEQKIEILKNLQTNNLTSDKSCCKITVLRLNGFEPGIYSVKCNFKVLNSLPEKGKFESLPKSISLTSKIGVQEGCITDLKDKMKEYTFQNVPIENISMNCEGLDGKDPLLKSFSGTSLSSFEIELTDSEGNKFMTHPQDIIDLYLKLSTTLLTELTVSKKDIDINLFAFKLKPSKIEKEYHVLVKVLLEIDLSVRMVVLERIHYIFKQIIVLRSIYENSQYQLLKFFENYHDDILTILDRNMTESLKGSCNDCSCIFI